MNTSDAMIGDKQVDLTIYVPCYNEEALIGKTLETICDSMKGFHLSYEVLVYDDHSGDNSAEAVKRFITEHGLGDKFFLITSEYNRGVGRNYFLAAERARGTHFMPFHGDNPLPAEELRKIIRLVGIADIIIPHFSTRIFHQRFNCDHRTLARRLISVTYNWLVRLLSGLDFIYFNGFVVHQTDNVLKNKLATYGLGYQAELLCRVAQDPNISYLEVRVHNYERTLGVSTALKPKNIVSTCGSLWRIFFGRFRRHV